MNVACSQLCWISGWWQWNHIAAQRNAAKPKPRLTLLLSYYRIASSNGKSLAHRACQTIQLSTSMSLIKPSKPTPVADPTLRNQFIIPSRIFAVF